MRVTGYEWLVKSYSACVTGPFVQRIEREFWRAHQQARLCVEFAKNPARPAHLACPVPHKPVFRENSCILWFVPQS